jgi:type III secretory pathway component EscR
MNVRLRKKYGLLKVTSKEVWDLDVTLVKYILTRLMKFKDVNSMSYPIDFSNIEEWHKIVDKMIWSFKRHLEDNLEKEETEQYKEGLHLFAEYFGDLWD